jgi:hypothetical protein
VQIVLGGAIRDEGIAVESDECTISIKESFYIGVAADRKLTV